MWVSDGANFGDKSEAELADNYLPDHLYTFPFRDGKGKVLSVVSLDAEGAPEVIEAEHPYGVRSKIKTTLTFVRSESGGVIKKVELKRFRYPARRGAAPEQISFSYAFFRELIGFLQGLDGLDLNTVNERRIPLGDALDLDAETKSRVRTVLGTPDGQALIREAVRGGDLTSADLVNIGYRKAQLAVFEKLIADAGAVERYRAAHGVAAGTERAWQHFFEANTWIFGYGLDFVFNRPLEGKRLEQTVQGYDAAGHGKRTDGLLKTAGIVSSLCLVEIKTPHAPLLQTEAEPYRDDCWRPSKDLSGGIAQAQKTAQKTIQNLRLSPVWDVEDRRGNPTGETLYSYLPKSYLIIGSLAEFQTEHGANVEKFASFELLRRHTGQPEIITFDELLERARFIVAKS